MLPRIELWKINNLGCIKSIAMRVLRYKDSLISIISSSFLSIFNERMWKMQPQKIRFAMELEFSVENVHVSLRNLGT